MPRAKAIRRREVDALRRALARTSEVAADQLFALCGRPVRSAAALREWHDALLFVLAHSPNAAVTAAAEIELHRVAGLAHDRIRSTHDAGQAFLNSGIAGAGVEGQFSLALVRWLLERWPADVQLVSIDAPVDEARELLRGLLLPVERETPDLLDDDIATVCATLLGSSPLATLISLLEQAPVSEHVRALWFARLQVRITVSGAAGQCSMTMARAPSGAPYALAAPFIRDVDVHDVVTRPLAAPVALPASERTVLLDTARAVLATLERETDPVTYAGAVSLHDMGRGLRIALYHLAPAHRLPFDSYVGFMAFRNGVPLAYGGAWIFPGRSKIGINVFEAQRGGESAWFFAQLLRLYAQTFAVTRFEVENYQLGFGNADGLRSGAYWFYYRLGFRPMSRDLQTLGAREFAKMRAQAGYTVPLPTLRTLVGEGLELRLGASAAAARASAPLDTAELTLAVQSHVRTRYHGDRRAAMQSALLRLHAALPLGDTARWRAEERAALELWALAIDVVPDVEQWTASERRALVRVIRRKGASTETEHQQLLAAHPRLLDAWQRYCNDLR